MSRVVMPLWLVLILVSGFAQVARAQDCASEQCKKSTDPATSLRCPCSDMFCSWSCFNAAHRVKRFGHCKSCGATVDMGPPPQPVQVGNDMITIAAPDLLPEFCDQSCQDKFRSGTKYQFREQALPRPSILSDTHLGGEPPPSVAAAPEAATSTAAPAPAAAAKPAAPQRSRWPLVLAGVIVVVVIGVVLRSRTSS